MKFPIDAPRKRVLKAFELLGFKLVREREHIAMVRVNPDGTKTPLTLPNHPQIKGSTLFAVSRESPARIFCEPTIRAGSGGE